MSGPFASGGCLRGFCTLFILLALGIGSRAAEAEDWGLEVDLQGQTLFGRPLHWNSQQVLLLQQDGQLTRFAPAEVTRFEKRPGDFRPLTASELRGQLLREFGSRFEVTGTAHFLVVHPAGQRDQWAPRFETMYRSFVAHFSSRGFPLQQPEFPLVAVVFDGRAAYDRHLATLNIHVAANVPGLFSNDTNRVYLYQDAASGEHELRLVIHEATHQAAFNTGVHNRVTTLPRWVAEGLAQVFEAPGVWNRFAYRDPADRVLPDILKEYLLLRKRQPARSFKPLLISDTPFRSHPGAAYAEAWALSFFLAEREPRAYAQYLRRLATQDPSARRSPTERLQDFLDCFGSDLKQLDARMMRYLSTL